MRDCLSYCSVTHPPPLVLLSHNHNLMPHKSLKQPLLGGPSFVKNHVLDGLTDVLARKRLLNYQRPPSKTNKQQTNKKACQTTVVRLYFRHVKIQLWTGHPHANLLQTVCNSPLKSVWRPKYLARCPVPSQSGPVGLIWWCLSGSLHSHYVGLPSAAGGNHVILTAAHPTQGPGIPCLFSVNFCSFFKSQLGYHSLRKVFSDLPPGSTAPCVPLLIACITAVILHTCTYWIPVYWLQ